MTLMRNAKKAIFALGMVILSLGVIFYLQGNSVIGPDISFMYSNPQWITYGLQMILLGVAMMTAGVFFGINRAR